jgi:heme/copper-type cytochrome/quinol oxidase subunit 2
LKFLLGAGFFSLALGGCDQNKIEPTAIPNPFVLEITGSNKSWSAKYPDVGDKNSGKVVPAARGLHLPLGTKIVLVLKSTDYVYTFAIPQQGLKEIAVPALEFRMGIRPTKARQLELVGEGLCGDPHTEVPGRLIFDSQARFLKWQRSQP